MKKIIFIVSTLNTGGAQKILSNLLMSLPDEYEADIVLNDAQNIVYPYKGNLISLGLKPQDNKLSLVYQTKVFLKRIIQLYKMKATKEYIAAVSFLDSANIANIVSGNRHCKTILSVHNNLTKAAASAVYKYIVNPLVKLMYGKADKVIAVSEGIAYDLINHLKLSDKNIVTVYNGHNIAEIRRMAKDSVPEEMDRYFQNTPVVATMGRLNNQKSQWHLIRAMKKVKEYFPKIRLLIMGDGNLRQYLEQLTDECGLTDNIIFCGFQKNPFSLLARSDIFVLPSMHEGFPNALIEALCCGLPCIATDFRSGAREILAPELPIEGYLDSEIKECSYGVLSPVCDGKKYDGTAPLTQEETLLAQAMIQLLQNTDMQQLYREKAVNAVEKFGIECMTKKWLEIINE